ncbi:hypothetical protein [Solimonas variicoloris]|uniref:hypothetical protein n=1 Tax=Solimonas variicoloris TaxID=254408 RepID=UPI0004771885|nr:hypothetical protein [Solimonas variicoloris]
MSRQEDCGGFHCRKEGASQADDLTMRRRAAELEQLAAQTRLLKAQAELMAVKQRWNTIAVVAIAAMFVVVLLVKMLRH